MLSRLFTLGLSELFFAEQLSAVTGNGVDGGTDTEANQKSFELKDTKTH